MHSPLTSVHVLSTASRVLLVFILYTLLLVATASLLATAGLVSAPAALPSAPDPIRGLPVIALASASLLSWFVLRSHWLGVKLALGLAVAFFGAHTVLPELDAMAAPGSFSRVAAGAAGTWFGGAVFAATFAAVAVVILGHTGRSPSARVTRYAAASWLTNAMKVAVAAGVLLVARPATVGPGLALGVELVRSLVWALLALLLVRLLGRGVIETSLAVGAFFALAAPVQRLLPNPLTPGDWARGQQWALAAIHLTWSAALAAWFCWDGPWVIGARRASSDEQASADAASHGPRPLDSERQCSKGP